MFHKQKYECQDCKGIFKHHDDELGDIKCPYCGSIRIKILQEENKIEVQVEVRRSFNIGDKIGDLVIPLCILALIGMLALTSLFQALTTSIPSTVIAMITMLLGILFVLGVAFAFYRYLVKGT